MGVVACNSKMHHAAAKARARSPGRLDRDERHAGMRALPRWEDERRTANRMLMGCSSDG
jgi:hypothetical protein